ncbi:MAG: hypothetical protein U0M51_02375 [Eggerthellaceae bacterium]
MGIDAGVRSRCAAARLRRLHSEAMPRQQRRLRVHGCPNANITPLLQ